MLFELFSIGVGPSSSHTVGPMRAARAFVERLANTALLEKTFNLKTELFGSLALTGQGHGTDVAVLNGLEGQDPEHCIPEHLRPRFEEINLEKTIHLLGKKTIVFNSDSDLQLHKQEVLPKHTNGMRFSAYNVEGQLLNEQIYYSIGGGFIVTDETYGVPHQAATIPYPFETAEELLTLCKQHDLTIAQLMMANETAIQSEEEVCARLKKISETMVGCIEKGLSTSGILPGGLNVKRRAPELYKKISVKGLPKPGQFADIMNWLNIFAMAVNEENAAGGRVVTAPTNGAAGIIPAVMRYYQLFCENASEQGVQDYLLTAGAIATLYKLRASISGAEVGCQGEVGVASSMAAGALAAVLGGTLEQIENAAEIAMEHHLGMTCDPIGGLVQIPCIERNAMGSVKAVNAAQLALLETGEHKVSLDKVIKTMFQTGKDMMVIYKETSLGGLAVNVTEC